MKKTFVLFFILSVFFLTIRAAAQNNGRPALYDAAAQQAARSMISDGRLEEALSKFQSMLDLEAKEIWTAQALLVCDAKDLDAKIVSLENVTPAPVIVIRRVIDSRTCYRVCAGLFRSRQEAAALGQQLPSPFKEAKPYALLLVSGGAFAKGAFDLAAPQTTSTAGEPAPASSVMSEVPSAPPGRGETDKQAMDEINNDAAQNLFNKGIEAFNRNELPNAESLFKRSIALAPERFEAYNNLGAILLHEKKYEEAKAVLEKACQLQPGYPNAHSNLAGAYWFLGKRQEAIAEAQRAFRLDSHNVRYCTNLASFLFEEKRYDDAQIYLNVVKMIDPANEDALAIQKKVDEARGTTGDNGIVVLDPASEPSSSGEKPGDADVDKSEKKKREKKQQEETESAEDEHSAGSGDDPKRSFWDRFKKHKTAESSDNPPEDGTDGDGPGE